MQVLWVLLPLALADGDVEAESEAVGSEEEHPLAHGVTLGSLGGLGGHTHVVPAIGGVGGLGGLGGAGGGGGAAFVGGDGGHVHFNTPFGHSVISLSGGGGGGGNGGAGGAGGAGGSGSGSGGSGGSCAIAYELQCANSGDSGPANSLLDCPSGEEEIW